MRQILFVLAAVLLIAVYGCDKEESKPITAPAGTGGSTLMEKDKEIELLRSMLKEDPDNLGALIRLGNNLMDTEKYKEAVEAYSKALEMDPQNVDVRVDMGICYRRAGMPDRAAEEFRKAIELYPRHSYAHMNLGVVLAYDLGKPKEAIEEFEKFIELDPADRNAPAIKQEIERLKGEAQGEGSQ